MEFAKTYVAKPQPFREDVLWTRLTKVEVFDKEHSERNEVRSNMVEVERCFSVAASGSGCLSLYTWSYET